MLFQVIKKVLKSRQNSNPKVVFVDVTYNQLFAILRRPCLSFGKEKNKLKMRRFWKTVRKLKGRIAISLYNVKRLQKYDDSQHIGLTGTRICCIMIMKNAEITRKECERCPHTVS